MKKSNPNTRQVGQIQPSQGLKAKPLLVCRPGNNS